MQYMLLIYVDPQTYAGVTDEESQAEMAEYYAFGPSLRERGIEVSGEGLQGVETATTVRVRDGKTLVTDGRFRRDEGASGRLLPGRCGQSGRGH